MIKAIIFDLDDTLIQTSKAKFGAIKHAGKTFYNLEISDQEIKSHLGKPFEQFMKDLFKGIDETEQIISNYYSIRSDFPTPSYPGTHETLLNLKNKFLLGIVTAATRHMAIEDLGIAKLDHLIFDYIQTSEETTHHKPDPKVFLPIVTKFQERGISKNELLYVGDSLSDYYAASGAEIKFVGIADRTTESGEFLKNKIKVIYKIEELESFAFDQDATI